MMRLILILLAASASLVAQCGKLVVNPTTGKLDCVGSGGGVTSVFTRTGAVVAASADYTAAQVTNAVDSTSTYSNPAWITALAYAKITGVPTFAVTKTVVSHQWLASYDSTTGAFTQTQPAATDISGIPVPTATFLLCAGPCILNETSNWKWTATAAVTIAGCIVDAVTYPTGAALKVDLLKNVGATTVFTSTVPTLADGSSAYVEQTGMAGAATLAKGDYLFAKVTQIGSTIAAQNVNLTCRLTY